MFLLLSDSGLDGLLLSAECFIRDKLSHQQPCQLFFLLLEFAYDYLYGVYGITLRSLGNEFVVCFYELLLQYRILDACAVALIAALPFLSGADPYVVAPFLAAVINLVTVGASAAAAYNPSCQWVAGMLMLHQLWICPFLPNRLCAIEGLFADNTFMGILDVISLSVAAI